MVDMKVNLCGIEMDNPVMGASGTFGYGYEFAELFCTYLCADGKDPCAGR